VQHIYFSAQGLASVVEDFLNVSKIEQGGLQYKFEDVDIKRLVTDLVRDMKMAAKSKKLEFAAQIHADGVHFVRADEVKLRQVFLNLIDNSIKYTKEGFVHVVLSYDQYDNKYVFSISDSGIGISKETKAKLFTKFGRGEGGIVNAGGSGLGLYLAQEIIKEHKGKISVTSEGSGKGSTFSVVLPCI
jgi:signal transduction histidine kinase